MKTYIPQLLEKTPEQLERIYFNLWFDYCNKHAYTSTDLQILITNKSLNQWFLTQLHHLENEFIQTVATLRLLKQTKHEIWYAYYLKTKKIHQLYPRKLLNQIRVKNPANKLQFTKYNLN